MADRSSTLRSRLDIELDETRLATATNGDTASTRIDAPGIDGEVRISIARLGEPTPESATSTEPVEADATARNAAEVEPDSAPREAESAVGPAATSRDGPESKATFELFEDRGGEWRWRLRHDNGNVIATSGQGYASKAGARKGLRSVRRNVSGAPIETVTRSVE